MGVPHLHLSRSVSLLRSYDEPNGYERRIPYKAILTISHLTDTTVYLSAAVGEIDMATWNAAMAMLKEQGVNTVLYERHGRMKTRNL